MWDFWSTDKSKGKTRHRTRPGSEDGSPLSSSRSLDKEASGERSEVSVLPENSTLVHFKDLQVPASDDESEFGDLQKAGSELHIAHNERQRQRAVAKKKLIIVLVGLPARGKTFLCNKVMCYLNWLGHETRHFNVGSYRRKQSGGRNAQQDASFFDHSNPAGLEARQQALSAALDDMEAWLRTDEAQVAIIDATNSTRERRELLRARFHGKWQYLFIESIVTDPVVLELNYRYKMMYSPDYKNKQNTDEALQDFQERIRKYEAVYETIEDRTLHYIKLIDMVTGRGHMDVNRISGYIPGKIVFFLMQICKAGMGRPRKIWLTRHGQSDYNLQAKIGGDSSLSPAGQAYARLLPDVIVERTPLTSEGETLPVAVWTSTLQRTIQTAEHLPFPKLRWKVLDEIQAGIFDGWTYQQIEARRPEEFAARKADKLTYRYPSGESYMDVIQRLEAVIIEVERERECVVVVAHQAVLRALYGYFIDCPVNEIPSLEIPLHTLIELTPKPDGKMAEERIEFDVLKKTRTEGHSFQRVSSRQKLQGNRASLDSAGPFRPLPALSFPRLKQSSTNPDLAALEQQAGSSHPLPNTLASLSMAKLAQKSHSTELRSSMDGSGARPPRSHQTKGPGFKI